MKLALVGMAAVFLAGLCTFGATNLNVVTWQYDNARTGLNPNETILKPANVRSSSFGKLFSQDVQGYVFAQPLYLSNVSIPGKGVHNVIFVATEADKVYAFDADDNRDLNADPLWMRSFVDSAAGVTTVPIEDVRLNDPPEIGITSTPVIDPVSGVLYVVGKTKELGIGGARYVLRLHALDVGTGLEKAGGPVELGGSVPGFGDSSVGGTVEFTGYYHFNRPGLLLQDGVIYIGIGTQGDITPSHGWIFAYDAKTLQQRGIFNTTPNGTLGGVWMSGGGLSADSSGNVYGITGNGTFTADHGGSDYGDSFLKLRLGSSGLQVLDYFTPFNQDFLSNLDADLGSGCALVLPESAGSSAHPRLLIGCGKEGRIYLLDRDNLGHFHSGADSQILQSFIGLYNGAWSCPAYFNHRVYFQGFKDKLRAFSINNAVFNTNAISISENTVGYPGLTPGISANGTNDAIVWAIQADGYNDQAPAILRAYDAYDLTKEIYNSTEAGARDIAGAAMKFTSPTVINGKVYVPVGNGLNVYGLLFSSPQIISQPQIEIAVAHSTATLEIEADGAGTLSYQWKFNGTNLVGATEPSLLLTNIQPRNAGIYTVQISNEYGSILSKPITLEVKPTLDIQLYAGLTINGRVGEVFAIEYTTNLDSGVWIKLTDVTLTATSQLWVDTESPASQQGRFYRAVQEL
jgi:hypothetical protein